MFNRDQPVEAPEYQIRLVPDGDVTRLTVTGADGRQDVTGAAPKILSVIAEQIR